MDRRRLLNAAAFVPMLSATACSVVSGIDEFVFRDPVPSSSGGSGGASTCVDPFVGMVITADTTLCAGNFALDVEPGTAVIAVEADDVTLTCEGTMLHGSGVASDSVVPATAGIFVGPRQGVTVRGCGARGYRIGLLAAGSVDLALADLALDDNYDNPDAPWGAAMRGGGLVLDGVTGGRVERIGAARNWHGIELRSTRGVTVEDSVADHCSNAGAILLDSHDNVLRGNDCSWGIRGQVSYPDAWYNRDTLDSAGIILDDGSSGNLVEGNDVTYGGDGVFARGVIGACAEGNAIVGNDISYSPHNGIESTCDDNRIEGNLSVESNYGIWTGGGDRIVVRDNVIVDSLVDGISIQIGSGRHVIVEENEISGSQRVGILVSGREYQQWHTLDEWVDSLANASQVVLQRNQFVANGVWDVFVTSARSVLLASNCHPSTTTVELGKEAEVASNFGDCQLAADDEPPVAALDVPSSVPLGGGLSMDASASLGDAPLHFTWLVQSSGARFLGGQLPPLLLGGPGAPVEQLVMNAPGAYDVDVTVDDGLLAAIAYRQVLVPPTGVRVGESAADWDYDCAGCRASFSDESGGSDGSFVRIEQDAFDTFTAIAPKSRDLGLDVTGFASLGLFVRGVNRGRWYLSNPVIALGSPTGTIVYIPSENILPAENDEWVYLEVPLAGSELWLRLEDGASPSAIDWIEVRATSHSPGVAVELDAITFY